MYVNEYAKTKIHIPGDLTQLPESALQEFKQESIDEYEDEKDKVRKNGVIWDSMFSSYNSVIVNMFVNTKTAFPDSDEVTIEELLDYNIADYEYEGAIVELQERKNVTVDGVEYVRDILNMKWDDDDTPIYEYDYMRKLDDGVVFFTLFNTIDTDKKPEYFESLFE